MSIDTVPLMSDPWASRIPPNQRPRYTPVERQAILEIMAANGWSLAQAARIFFVDVDTIAAWTKRLDDDSLVRTPVPINKFPDFVHHIVQRLKILCPLMGKKRIAHFLALAGLKISSSSVGRFIKKPSQPLPPLTPRNAGQAINFIPLQAGHLIEPSARKVISRYPNNIWHIDLTVVPTSNGFRTAWFPFSLPQCWPFCYWVAVIIDHFSRKIIGFAVFKHQPDSLQIRSFLGRAIRAAGQTPKYIISDKGSQFWCNPSSTV